MINEDDEEEFVENDNLKDESDRNNLYQILDTNLPKGHSLVISKKKRSIFTVIINYIEMRSRIGENKPVSFALDKIKSFLPILEEANKKLTEKPPEEVQIEWKEEEDRDEPHIEMEFALTELDSEGEEEEEDDEEDSEEGKDEKEQSNNNNNNQLIIEL